MRLHCQHPPKSTTTAAQELAAEAVSFVASDVNKIFEGIQEIHYLWTAPFEALAILVLLAALVGVYSLPGRCQCCQCVLSVCAADVCCGCSVCCGCGCWAQS